jgi:dihydroxyacetone kinase
MTLIIVDKLKANLVRVYVGTLMTSLEMAGVSLTLLQTPTQWVELLGKLTN